MEIENYLVEAKRLFSLHPYLLDEARCSLERAEKKEDGWQGDAMVSTLLSAMAAEAFVNVVGSRLFDDWRDFERSSVTVRYRVICLKLGINYSERQSPWRELRTLSKFRNDVVHGKPELVESKKFVHESIVDKAISDRPESKLEKKITLELAAESKNAVKGLMKYFFDAMRPELSHEIQYSSWSSSAAPQVKK